jgi:hypothetical protein
VRCDTERQPGEQVIVTTRAGKQSTVTLGERQNRLGFIYAIVRSPRRHIKSSATKAKWQCWLSAKLV